jgi:hypothetical protein
MIHAFIELNFITRGADASISKINAKFVPLNQGHSDEVSCLESTLNSGKMRLISSV